MFSNYPKQRQPLPKAYADIYARQYKSNRYGETAAAAAAQVMESWLHRQVAADVAERPYAALTTLELGAGTLNQLPYEPASRYYDIVEPFQALFETSPHLPRIRHIFADISDVPQTHRYERITSVATLEHIWNLPEVVARSGILLAEKGVFRAGIPSEGTWLWGLGWRLTTGLEFRLRHGLDYGVLMRYEHVSTAREIEDVLAHFFADIRCSFFGLSRALSIYQFFECRRPHLERCHDYLGLD